MSLVLDARQRAMLEEMGVKVWLPTARPAPEEPAVDVPVADARVPVAAPEARPAAPTRASRPLRACAIARTTVCGPCLGNGETIMTTPRA